jgi:small-conductance mechanosensitive channel
MKIDKALLAEVNYEGSRLIKIENETVTELQKELSALQKEINPILDKLNAEYYTVIDPIYQEVQKLNEEIKSKKFVIQELTKKFQPEIDSIEATEQKAQLVKNKLQPILLELVKEQLDEFEVARHTVNREDGIYVEVFDEIEEKVKSIRASKAKK